MDPAWGWRMAYMVQWVWPVPLLIGAFWAPESEFLDFLDFWIFSKFHFC